VTQSEIPDETIVPPETPAVVVPEPEPHVLNKQEILEILDVLDDTQPIVQDLNGTVKKVILRKGNQTDKP
jgi:hypothetical protein